MRTSNNVRYSATYTGTSSSGVRGNPWAAAGSQWAPPPKAPTARKAAPPPSAGARRYEKFDAPKSNSNWAQNEGPEARAKTYEAWENMRGQGHGASHTNHTSKPGPGRTRAPPPKVPPRDTPQSGRNASNAQGHGPPPQARPGYGDFHRDTTTNTSPRRSSSMNGRKGFMPNTPGGDEPAASKGAYFTTQRAAPGPPPVPPRNPSPMGPPPSTNHAGNDPLRQFRDQPYEPRASTPYSTQGGEKFNPFESANISRSKSTREPKHSQNINETNSDPFLASPQRTQSFADRQTRARKPVPRPSSSDHDSNSSFDDGPVLTGGAFGRRRVSKNIRKVASPAAQAKRAPQAPKATENASQSRESHTNVETFRQWMKEHPGEESSLKDFLQMGLPLTQKLHKPRSTTKLKCMVNLNISQILP